MPPPRWCHAQVMVVTGHRRPGGSELGSGVVALFAQELLELRSDLIAAG